jgi:hypothetical protein
VAATVAGFYTGTAHSANVINVKVLGKGENAASIAQGLPPFTSRLPCIANPMEITFVDVTNEHIANKKSPVGTHASAWNKHYANTNFEAFQGLARLCYHFFWVHRRHPSIERYLPISL